MCDAKRNDRIRKLAELEIHKSTSAYQHGIYLLFSSLPPPSPATQPTESLTVFPCTITYHCCCPSAAVVLPSVLLLLMTFSACNVLHAIYSHLQYLFPSVKRYPWSSVCCCVGPTNRVSSLLMYVSFFFVCFPLNLT